MFCRPRFVSKLLSSAHKPNFTIFACDGNCTLRCIDALQSRRSADAKTKAMTNAATINSLYLCMFGYLRYALDYICPLERKSHSEARSWTSVCNWQVRLPSRWIKIANAHTNPIANSEAKPFSTQFARQDFNVHWNGGWRKLIEMMDTYFIVVGFI